MKCWRVMGNNMKRGTWCEVDMLMSKRNASSLCKKYKHEQPSNNFFVQEYEEARVGVNVLSKEST